MARDCQNDGSQRSTFIDGIDFDGDGTEWSNPSHAWSIANQGCPSSQGKALKGNAQTPPTTDFVLSEYFRTINGHLDCGAAVYSLTFDARSEALLNPRIDWEMTIRDGTNNANVILIHWASTQSNYPGVIAAQGGNARGRVLVQNPAGTPAFISTGFAIPANSCYSLKVVLNNPTNQVQLFVNGTLRVTTGRLNPSAARMDYFKIEPVANGQTSGGLNRLALDNLAVCRSGAALENWPDCDANCVDDAHDPDCNSDGTPEGCDTDPAFLRWVNADGPSARDGHVMAYDSARAVTVLFGGFDGTSHTGDTSEWDGSTWLLRATTGPSPRSGHAMVYDIARGVTRNWSGGCG